MLATSNGVTEHITSTTGSRNQKAAESMIGKLINHPETSKQVYQFTLEGKLVREWPSTAEVGRNGFNQGHVASCCNGKLKTHKGYKWSYEPL